MPDRTFAASPTPSRWRWPVAALLALGAALLAVLGVQGWSADRIEYRVGGGRLVAAGGARWASGERDVALSDITEVREITLGAGHRTFGTGAPGVCVGEFTYVDVGPVWQATDCSHEVLLLAVRGADRPVVVAPTDRAGFRRALADGGPAVFRPAPPPGGTSLVLRLVPIVGATLLIALVVLIVAAKPLLSYTVRDGELVVRTALMKRRFPLAGRTARVQDGHPRLRLFGAGLPGYYTGLFNLEDGNARVYATRFHHGVLLDGQPRVFVTPADVDGFVAALREAGAR